MSSFSVFSLGYATIANGLTAAIGGVAYLFFSANLTPAQFAIYALCIISGRMSTTIIDGGLKIHLLKQLSQGISTAASSAKFLCWLYSLGLLGTALIVNIYGVRAGIWTLTDGIAVLGYATAYLITYPPLLVYLAYSEFNGRFKSVSTVEFFSNTAELILPLSAFHLNGFHPEQLIFCAFIGRMIRFLGTRNISKPYLHESRKIEYREAMGHAKETISMQTALVANLTREHSYTASIGAIAGRTFLGQYTWASQICSMIGQIITNTATRLQLAHLAKEQGVSKCLDFTESQIRMMSLMLMISCLAAYFGACFLNEFLFEKKWAPAITLLPLLLFRAWTSAITTPIGCYLLIKEKSRTYLNATLFWTLTEITIYTTTHLIFGFAVLPISIAIGGVVGVAIFSCYMPSNRFSFQKCILISLQSKSIALTLTIGIMLSTTKQFMVT